MYDDMMIQELNEEQLEWVTGGNDDPSAASPTQITINNTNAVSLTASLSANGTATANPSVTNTNTFTPSNTNTASGGSILIPVFI